ncbi:MAG: hypothetical protein ACI85H_001197 [Paracoccaceae bacterium]|jgi:hypothetical protein
MDRFLQGQCQVNPLVRKKMNLTPQRQNIGIDRPGVPTLSPDMQRLRLRILLSVADLSFEGAIDEIRNRVRGEPAEMIRIALLAAQSWLVRERMMSMSEGKNLKTVKSVLYPQEKSAPVSRASATKIVPIHLDDEVPESPEEEDADQFIPELDDGWRRIHIISDAVVNGVRFFAGTVVEVGPIDAQKLIASNKAELLMGGVGVRPNNGKAKPARATKTPAKSKAKPSLSPVAKEDMVKTAQAEAELEDKLTALQEGDDLADLPDNDESQGKAVVIARSEVTDFDEFDALPNKEEEGGEGK